MRTRHVLTLALLSAIWGASYLLIKYAVRDLHEPAVVFGRTALASAAILVYIRIADRRSWSRLVDAFRRPLTAFTLGLTAIGAPFVLITYGERTVPSGLTATLIASAPLFVAIFAPFLDRSEIMAPLQWVGLLVGLVGVGLIVGVEQIRSLGAFVGAMAVIAAAASYGVSGFVLKRGYPGVPPVATTFVSTATAAVATIPLVVADPPTRVPGGLAIFSLVVLGLVGTAFAFVVYYRLIGEVGFGRATVVAYTIPPVALLYGWGLLGEQVSAPTIGGMVLILMGVYLIARRGRASGVPAPVPGPEGATPQPRALR